MILSKEDIDTLYGKLNLAFKEHGFTPLDDDVIDQFVDQHLCDLKICDGKKKNESLSALDGTKFIVWQIRNHRGMMFVMNAASKIKRCFKNEKLFQNSFSLEDSTHSTRQFDDEDVRKWIEIAKKKRIPPYAMLKQWLIQKHSWSKQSVKRFMKSVRSASGSESERFMELELQRNISFRTFCKEIYESDFTSGSIESVIVQKSEAFERMVQYKMKCLLQRAGIHREMQTEKEQLQKAGDKQKVKATPDLLLCGGEIIINGHQVHWIEMKNFFLSKRDTYPLKKVKKTIRKYRDHFGFGALVCRGFQYGIDKQLEEIECLLLDGSNIEASLKMELNIAL